MDVRGRVEGLAAQLPAGVDMDDWFAPGARLSLPSVGLERDLREVLAGLGPLHITSCEVELVRVVRNVVMANWIVALESGRGGEGLAVLSFDRMGLVTHLRLEGALLVVS